MSAPTMKLPVTHEDQAREPVKRQPTSGNGRYEARAGLSEHNSELRRRLFAEIEDGLDAAEQNNGYRKISVEIDVVNGRFETGGVTVRKTLK